MLPTVSARIVRRLPSASKSMVSPSDKTRISSSVLASINVKPITPVCNIVGAIDGAAEAISVGEPVGADGAADGAREAISVGELVGADVEGSTMMVMVRVLPISSPLGPFAE